MSELKRLTEKQFETFEVECRYWLDYFGCQSYSVSICKNEKSDDCRAYTTRCRPGHNRMFAIFLVMQQDDLNFPSDYRLRECAFHEVLEVLMCDISDFIAENEGSGAAANSIHTVIRTLENTLFRDSYKARFKKGEKK